MRFTKANVTLGVIGIILLFVSIMLIAVDIDTGIMSGLDLGHGLFIVGLIVTIVGVVKYFLAPSKVS